MAPFRDSLFEGDLEIIQTLSGDAIQASLYELRHQDRLTIALRHALKRGVSINDLSAASGLTAKEIQRRCEMPLAIGEDLATLTGNY